MPTDSEPQDVIKIDTDLVPVNVTVTDARGPVAPDAFDSRTRHGDGAHDTYRALILALLLIWMSAVIAMPSLQPS